MHPYRSSPSREEPLDLSAWTRSVRAPRWRVVAVLALMTGGFVALSCTLTSAHPKPVAQRTAQYKHVRLTDDVDDVRPVRVEPWTGHFPWEESVRTPKQD